MVTGTGLLLLDFTASRSVNQTKHKNNNNKNPPPPSPKKQNQTLLIIDLVCREETKMATFPYAPKPCWTLCSEDFT